ncbi:MAG: ABC transporter substrate binding protein [Chloroflexota bacterium]
MKLVVRNTFVAVSILVLVFSILALTVLDSLAAGQETKRVFVLNSFNRGYSWTDNMLRGIDDSFVRSGIKIETYVTFMDMKRVPPTPQYFVRLKELIKEGYKGVRFDAVLACDNDALEFLRKYRDELFPGVPVVFSSINNFDEKMLDGRKDITGTSENTDYEGTIKLALNLRPATKNIVVVVDDTTTGKAHRSAVEKIRDHFPQNIAFTYLSLADLTLDELAQKLSQLSSDSVVLLLQHFVDKNGATYTVQESTPLLTKSAAVPVFILTDIRLGLGALGGDLVSGYYHGEAAAQMVVKILNGTDVKSIPVLLDSPNKYMFDYNVMQRFNIVESNLPQDSIVINRPVYLLDEYRPHLFVIMVAFITLCGILVFLLFEIRRRKKIETALLESESILKKAEKAAHIGNWVWHIPSNRLIWSDQMYDLFGINRKEFSGELSEVIGRAIHPEDRAAVEQSNLSVITDKKPIPLEYRIIRSDGAIRVVWAEAGELILDDANKPLTLTGIVQDITERKQAEKEKEQLQDQLLQAQKMESVGRLAGGVAHDFNNWLGVIMGHAEMAAAKTQLDQEIRKDLLSILNAAQHSAELTRQLLAFARKQPIYPRVLDLNAAISDILDMLRRLIGEDIQLIWKPGKDLWHVRFDPSQIDQILANLLINARDAIAGAGEIVIETENIVCNEAYCAGYVGFSPGEYALLSVSDNGSGMDQETLAHIFEPFYTTKVVGKGIGLGLATVYGIINQNNGYIQVSSQPGQGTTFKIYLPRVEADVAKKAAAESIDLPLKATETVLLVEDEQALLEMQKDWLEELGYKVLAAGTPAEALRLAEDSSVGFIHLLITDMVMPGLNGRQLAERLSVLQPDMKCLFMSGYTADIIAERGVLPEGVHFIQKPFLHEDLAVKVYQALRS